MKPALSGAFRTAGLQIDAREVYTKLAAVRRILRSGGAIDMFREVDVVRFNLASVI